MTERELRKLSRLDLVELLLSQQRENEKLRQQLSEMEERLRNQCAPLLSVFSDVCGDYPELTVKTLS